MVGELIQAMAYDNPVPGFDTYNTNSLRLWRACPAEEFDFIPPTMAVVETMRLLVDIRNLPWEQAWHLTRKTCNYTNHAVMPEAPEKWPVEMMEQYCLGTFKELVN